MLKPHLNSRWYPWACWLLATTVYLMQFALLAFPSSISQALEKTLSTDTSGVGVFYSAYLYTYVLMQIPAGYLFDHFKANALLTIATLLMAAGCLLLYFSHNLTAGIISRMIMGCGASFGFLGSIYLARNWFSASLFPVIAGLTAIFSGIGIMGVNALFEILSKSQSWQTTLLEIFFILLVLSLLIALFVRERFEKEITVFSIDNLKKNAADILKNRLLGYLMLYVGFGYVYYMTITGMWNIAFVEHRFHVSTIIASFESALTIMGIIIGGPLCGYLARSYSSLKIMFAGALLQLLTLSAMTYLSTSLITHSFLALVLGVSTGSIILSFNVLRKNLPTSLYGLASGVVNISFSVFSILLSPLVGYIFQSTSKNEKITMIPILICSLLSLLFCVILLYNKQEKNLTESNGS